MKNNKFSQIRFKMTDTWKALCDATFVADYARRMKAAHEEKKQSIDSDTRKRMTSEAKKACCDAAEFEACLKNSVLSHMPACKCTFAHLCRAHLGLLDGHVLQYGDMDEFSLIVRRVIPASLIAAVAVTFMALDLVLHAIAIAKEMASAVIVPLNVTLEQFVIQLCLLDAPCAGVLVRHLDIIFARNPDKRAELKGIHGFNDWFCLKPVFIGKKNVLDVLFDASLGYAAGTMWYRRILGKVAMCIMDRNEVREDWHYTSMLKPLTNLGIDVSRDIGVSFDSWLKNCDDDAILVNLMEITTLCKHDYFTLVWDATRDNMLDRLIRILCKARVPAKYVNPFVVLVKQLYGDVCKGIPRFEGQDRDKKINPKWARHIVDTAAKHIHMDNTNFYTSLQYAIPFISVLAAHFNVPWPPELGEQSHTTLLSLVDLPFGPWIQMCQSMEDCNELAKRKRDYEYMQTLAKK